MTRDEAIIHLTGAFLNDPHREHIEAMDLAIKALLQPDIIRCRECCFCATMPPNYTWCDNHKIFVEPGDFCSYGERR